MDLIPGFLQGLTRVVVSYPFDYVRLYFQSNYTSSYYEFFKNNNIKSLYRGCSILLFSVPIERSIQFKIYETLNQYKINPYLSGLLCGSISPIFNLPINHISNNYILSNNKSVNIFIDKIKIKNLYNGFKPELIRSTLASCIYLGTYGQLRHKFGNDINQTVINSVISGMTVWTITYPFDTLKLEQQLSNKNLIDCFNNRIKQYNILNLWKGILPIYIRTIPSSIIGMIVYEHTKNYIEINKKNYSKN